MLVLSCCFAKSLAFMDILEFISAQELEFGEDRFAARNFRLECGLLPQRVDGYLCSSPLPPYVADPAEAVQGLDAFHKRYIRQHVQAGVRTDLFTQTATSCPDTFRPGCHLDEYGMADDNLDLVRIEDLRFLARIALWESSEASPLLARVAESNRANRPITAEDQHDCQALLTSWQQASDNRPLFATFWEDAKEVLSSLAPNWAEELRDRLGLAHYDPSTRMGPIPIVVFRYPVRRVPRRKGVKERFLVRPSVLDGTLNPAFYTGPPGSGVGSTVDLTLRDDDPWQEVVHPAMPLGPGDVWAVGQVTAAAPDPLTSTRGHHSLKLMLKDPDSDFSLLCEEVDGDLL